MNQPPLLPQDQRRFSLAEFVSATEQQDRGQGLFELETPRMLELNLNGRINTKLGSMVSYRGKVKFTREGILDQGVGNLLKKAVSGEGMRLTYAEGQGQVYLADAGKKITILNLEGDDGIIVNGNDVLAFEPTLNHKISMMKKIAGLAQGGLFNVAFKGSGLLAITSHYEPVTLRVTPNSPVFTDPNATIAWSDSLSPSMKTDVSLKSFFGRSSGESFQMAFEGDGFVVIQPYEEVYLSSRG
ncbi:AIM24 family protein [Rubritalea sp.]|uniref:AIM24 family protein n=1 Tax=Rubritalea sp. TaxID=2109375 RepID=UPI003EF1BA78